MSTINAHTTHRSTGIDLRATHHIVPRVSTPLTVYVLAWTLASVAPLVIR